MTNLRPLPDGEHLADIARDGTILDGAVVQHRCPLAKRAKQARLTAMANHVRGGYSSAESSGERTVADVAPADRSRLFRACIFRGDDWIADGPFAARLSSSEASSGSTACNIHSVGKLVEAVTDQSLEVYFPEHIFEPPGMRDMGFLIGSEQKRRVATLHRPQADGS